MSGVPLPGWQAVVVPLMFWVELAVMLCWFLIRRAKQGTQNPEEIPEQVIRTARARTIREEEGK